MNTKSVSVPVASIKALVVDDGYIFEDDVEILREILTGIKRVFKEFNVPYYGTGYIRGSVRGTDRYCVSELHPYFTPPSKNHYRMVEDLVGELKESRFRRRR